MRHDKILKREDGTQFRISVLLFFPSYSLKSIEYRISVYFKEKSKRLWKGLIKDIPDYKYRLLTSEQRAEYDYQNKLRYVTEEEIQEASLELWNLLKP
jgi:hypothetical protein